MLRKLNFDILPRPRKWWLFNRIISGILQFSIRDMLLFTALAAMSCGWWLDRAKLIAKQRENSALRQQVGLLTKTIETYEAEQRGRYP
jgi:hypothetical protein